MDVLVNFGARYRLHYYAGTILITSLDITIEFAGIIALVDSWVSGEKRKN